jgi:FkbM family methyltransferase
VATRQAQASIEALAQMLGHYDRSQLLYQLGEIVGERTYLRHGVDVREGDVVLDVGANVGVAAAFFAVECRAGSVHSFEPVPALFDWLRRNLLDLPGCMPHPYGLSSRTGHATMVWYPAAAAMSGLYADPDRDRALVRRCLLNMGLSGERAEEELAGRHEPTRVECELRRLSDVLREEWLERVDLLKIDVERAELDVLEGIEEPDWHRIRQVVAEVHDERGRLKAIARTLQERGFEVVTDQDPLMAGTPVQMVYAHR